MAEAANTPPDAQRVRRRRIVVAVSLWIGLFLWANIPPFRGNILHHRSGFFVWHWRLYSDAGHGICDVRYFDANNNGAPIERWKLLGYERPGLMPDGLARTKKTGLFTDFERVCNKLREQGEPEPNVEAWARCADKARRDHRDRWKVVERRRRNVCLIPEKQREATRQKRLRKAKAARAKAAKAAEPVPSRPGRTQPPPLGQTPARAPKERQP
jgi:hypothetical protein